MLVLNMGMIFLVFREWYILIFNNGFLWFLYLEYFIYLGLNVNIYFDYDIVLFIDFNICCIDVKVSVCSNYIVIFIKNYFFVIFSLLVIGNILVLKYL